MPVGVCGCLLVSAGVCWCLLVSAGVCLAYIDVSYVVNMQVLKLGEFETSQRIKSVLDTVHAQSYNHTITHTQASALFHRQQSLISHKLFIA